MNESLVGYLMRAAEANDMVSRESLLQSFFGTATRPPNHHEIERLATFTRCSISEIAQLFGFEERREDNHACWRIGGEWITKRNFVTSRTMACCPECLQSDPYLPGVWELIFYRSCAVHQTNLVYQCPGCRKPLRWTRPGICTCTCGFDLRRTRSVLGSRASWMLAQLIEHRLYPDFKLVVPSSLPIHMVERLAGLTLDGLFKTIWFLGHCVSDPVACATGHGRVQSRGDQVDRIIEDAFSVLANWPHSLGERLAVIADRPNGNKRRSLYQNVLGPIASYMAEEVNDDELRFLRSTYEFHIREIWRHTGRRAPEFGGGQMELDLIQSSASPRSLGEA